jgi:hypothetical protein
MSSHPAHDKPPRVFVGVDGEGGDIDGHHEYLLLRAGNQVLETGHPLTAEECLGFLADLNPNADYVAYFFDYDVTMMLRSLPEHTIRSLLDRESRVRHPNMPPRPVSVGYGFLVDYLAHKEFRVRRILPGGRLTPWVVISDVGTFFQCSFLTAITKWGVGTDANRGDIARGKEGRATFGALTDETRRYNLLEIELLEDLMAQFRQTCIAVGYIPRMWQGPGNMATAMLRTHKLPTTTEYTIPDGVWQFAQNAYYGGRFETTAVGPVTGPVYQYDINSAYPWACTVLPCLAHASWHHTSVPRGMGVYQIRFTHSRRQNLHHFPMRRPDGSIHYPRMGKGWYWWAEIEAARQAGADVTFLEGWYLSPGCSHRPFSWVNDVYLRRLALGKSDKGMVLKLGLNSLYGKQAQSIGAAPYANPIYAGLITALTRAKLISAYSHDPNSVVMLATDGLFTLSSLPLLSSEELGGWDLVTHDDGMFIIQPGLYFAGTEKPKTRGVPMGKVFEQRADFERAWAESGGKGSVELHLKNFIGLRLAYARNKPATAGEWLPGVKEVSFDWKTKRRPRVVRHDGRAARTFPYEGSPIDVTVPYGKVIGGNLLRDVERLEWDDKPDWADDWRGLE